MTETFNITDRITGNVIQGSSTPVEVIHQVIITLNDCIHTKLLHYTAMRYMLHYFFKHLFSN
jgi:hypothetical protein